MLATASSRRTVHADAIREAYRVHKDLATDLERRIDPFTAAAAYDLTIAFRPLDALAGVYLPATSQRGAGVLVNSQHPYSKQRYTAGHELGHHLKRASIVVDADTEVVVEPPTPPAREELFCEAFAAWFLMPRRLVDAKLDELDLPYDHHDARAIYRLGLELGTSYLATATHLFGIKRLSWLEYERLRVVQPKAIKNEIAGLRRVEARPDVWVVGASGANSVIRPFEGDDLVIALEEDPRSGRVWELQTATDQLVQIGTQPSDSTGNSQIRRFVFHLTDLSLRTVRLVQRSEAEALPWRMWELNVEITPRLHGIVLPADLLGADT